MTRERTPSPATAEGYHTHHPTPTPYPHPGTSGGSMLCSKRQKIDMTARKFSLEGARAKCLCT